MTDEKTTFEIEPTEPATTYHEFSFKEISKRWLAFLIMPVGLIALTREGEREPEVSFNPQSIWLIEPTEIETEEEQPATKEPFTEYALEPGLCLSTMAGEKLILDSELSACLEFAVKRFHKDLVAAGVLKDEGSLIEVPKHRPAPNAIFPPFRKK